jgi:hypothetical protein
MASEENVVDYVNGLARQFSDRVQERYEGHEPLAFMGEDVISEMLDHLADTVIVCNQQAVKLMMLQDHLTDVIEGVSDKQEGGDLQVGVGTFIPSKKGI